MQQICIEDPHMHLNLHHAQQDFGLITSEVDFHTLVPKMGQGKDFKKSPTLKSGVTVEQPGQLESMSIKAGEVGYGDQIRQGSVSHRSSQTTLQLVEIIEICKCRWCFKISQLSLLCFLLPAVCVGGAELIGDDWQKGFKSLQMCCVFTEGEVSMFRFTFSVASAHHQKYLHIVGQEKQVGKGHNSLLFPAQMMIMSFSTF